MKYSLFLFFISFALQANELNVYCLTVNDSIIKINTNKNSLCNNVLLDKELSYTQQEFYINNVGVNLEPKIIKDVISEDLVLPQPMLGIDLKLNFN